MSPEEAAQVEAERLARKREKSREWRKKFDAKGVARKILFDFLRVPSDFFLFEVESGFCQFHLILIKQFASNVEVEKGSKASPAPPPQPVEQNNKSQSAMHTARWEFAA